MTRDWYMCVPYNTRYGNNCDKIIVERKLCVQKEQFRPTRCTKDKKWERKTSVVVRKEKKSHSEKKGKKRRLLSRCRKRGSERPRWHVTSFKCGYMPQNNSPLSSWRGPINCLDPGGNSSDPGPESELRAQSARMQIQRPRCYRWELRLRYTCRGGNQTDDF